MWIVIKERCPKKLLRYILNWRACSGGFSCMFPLRAVLAYLRSRYWKAFCFLLAHMNVVCTYADGRKACSDLKGHPCLPAVLLTFFPRTLLVFTSLLLKPGTKGNEAKSKFCFCNDGSASRVALPAGKKTWVCLLLEMFPGLCVNTVHSALRRVSPIWNEEALCSRKRSGKGELLRSLRLILLKNKINVF